MEKAQKESKHVLGWIFGVLFLVVGLAMFTSSFISGLMTTALGLILLPPSRKWLEEKINKKLSRAVIIGVGIVMLGIAGAALPSDTQTNTNTQVAELPAEQPVEVNTTPQNEPETEEVTDTVTVEDTVEIEEPVQEEPEVKTGINVSRSIFVDKFENVDYLNVTFGAGVPVDGSDNYTANDGAVVLQLIGPEENLEQASVFTFASADDVNSNAVALAAMVDFISTFDQSINDDQWILDEIEALTPGESYSSSIQRNGRNVRFEYEPALGSFVVIVEPQL